MADSLDVVRYRLLPSPLPSYPCRQYRVVNTSNAVFLRDVVAVQGGVELMVALGFREDADGHLVLPMVRKEQCEYGMRNELEV